jgi:hypothetical protein
VVSKVLWISNDNLIRLLNLKDTSGGDDVAGTAVTTATVTAVVKDSADTTVDTVSLTFQAGTNGDYEGILADTTSLTEGAKYSIEITADDGADRRGFWTMQGIIARVRKA